MKSKVAQKALAFCLLPSDFCLVITTIFNEVTTFFGKAISMNYQNFCGAKTINNSENIQLRPPGAQRLTLALWLID
ncbi:MAG: hypothetical protein N2235_18505 [Fischerella sp.]|nr:hypothetical protein [Fischerella sp.]